MANNQLLAHDTFASGSLDPGWSALTSFSACQVVNIPPHVTEANSLSTEAAQIWTGLTWPKDQISEATINNLTAETGVNILVLYLRMQPGANSGYQVNIQNNNSAFTAQMFKVTAGTTTALGVSVSLPATPFGGAVFSFGVAGSCLVLYQNGTFVSYAYDATYTSGTPGFGLYTTVNLAHAQVSSWRGYSAIQQDGIWQKQGVVIPANAADLAQASGLMGPQNPTMLYEGNAQILSGTVYKMWFATSSATGNQIGYAESTDGLNWTRRSSNVITTVGNTPCVIKVSSTYHLYDGAGTIQHWTSSDGITWTQAQANVFTQTHCMYFSPVAIIAGTWYALYALVTAAFPITSNLATSPDGVTWTAYGSNPVVSNFWGITRVSQIGSVYYAWGQTTNPNAQETTKPSVDPGKGMRMKTSDFITWTNPVQSISNSQLHSGVNQPDGGAYCSFPLDNISGVAYLYYSSGPDDAIQTSQSILQMALAIGPAPIASIVTNTEGATQQTATDSFASLTNWTTPTGQNPIQLSGGKGEGTVTGANNAAVFTGAGSPTGNNQYSEVTVAAHSLASYVIPAVLMSTSSATWYDAYVLGPAASLNSACVMIQRFISGSPLNLLAATVAATPTVGDVWRLVATALSGVGTVLSLYQNGHLIAQVADTSASALTTGQPGFLLNPQTSVANAQVSLWAGGNASVIPVYPSTGQVGAFLVGP